MLLIGEKIPIPILIKSYSTIAITLIVNLMKRKWAFYPIKNSGSSFELIWLIQLMKTAMRFLCQQISKTAAFKIVVKDTSENTYNVNLYTIFMRECWYESNCTYIYTLNAWQTRYFTYPNSLGAEELFSRLKGEK